MAVDKLDNRNRLLQQMGLIYSQIMDLNEQMTDALQKAVDIDISVTGGVSDITKDFMEGFHYKIDESARVVSEQKKWEYDQLPSVKETELPQIQQDTDIPKRIITQEELNGLLHEHREHHEAGNYEILDLSNCIFNEILFTGALSGINLRNSEFNACTFRNAGVEDSYLSNAEFMNTVFSECVFDNTLFDQAEMGYCTIEYTNYTHCQFNKAAMVACEIESSGMNDCDMMGAVVSDTKCTDTIVNTRFAFDIDFSGVDKNLRNSAENTFNNYSHYDFEIKPDNEVVVRAHTENGTIEKNFKVDYNPDTHKIGKISALDFDLSPENSFLLDKIVDMLRMDIQKGFQKQQFYNRDISYLSPCVMIETSDIVGLNEDTLYDIKEFSDKIDSYERDKGISKSRYNQPAMVEYKILFDSGDGNGVRMWKGCYRFGIDMDSPIKNLENSSRFNNAEVNYLKNYINGEKLPSIEYVKTQPEHQEMKETTQQKIPTEQEVSVQRKTSQLQKPQNDKHQTAIPAKYAAFVYVKGSNVKTRVTGTSPENIIKLCQKWNTERASDNQLGTAYISKYNSETKKYENFGKYDISNGVELQPIYLELPSVGKQKFGQLTSELKANGAKFNPELKKWYITQACDLKLFAEYLPKQSEHQIDVKGQQDRKTSVLDNLSQNKSNLNEKSYKESQPHEQHRKQDAVTR